MHPRERVLGKIALALSKGETIPPQIIKEAQELDVDLHSIYNQKETNDGED
jgi:starvation-inducible outer membrane lipoprotein